MFERIHKLFSIDSNFIWSDVVRVILVRQFVHCTTHFFTATKVDHGLSELLITDEPVVNTQEMSLLALLLERIRDEVLVIPLASSRNGAREVALALCGSQEQKGGPTLYWMDFLFSSVPFRKKVPARAVDDVDVPV